MEFNQLQDKLHRWIMLSLSVSVTSLVFRNVVGRLMLVQGGEGFKIQVGSEHTKNLRSTASTERIMHSFLLYNKCV